MIEIELPSIDSILENDIALGILVNSYIGSEEGDFKFVLPLYSEQISKDKLDTFCSKLNFTYNSVGRLTRILPCSIKMPVVVSEPEVVPEPVVVTEPEPEPEVVAKTAAFVPKRKK